MSIDEIMTEFLQNFDENFEEILFEENFVKFHNEILRK